MRAIVDFYSMVPEFHAAPSSTSDAEQSYDAGHPDVDSSITSSHVDNAPIVPQAQHTKIAAPSPDATLFTDIAALPQTQTTAAPRARPHYERAVPLTRAPLRTAHLSLSWPAMVDARATSASRAERHTWLKAANDDTCSEAALLAAYREEDADGRLLALQSLVRCRFAGARDCLLDALRLGSDEERAFAVDGLVALGDRASLGIALADRVDAIAARAALGFVASDRRVDYATALTPYLDERRIEAILGLLAGVLR